MCLCACLLADEVDLGTSFPFSRFVKDQTFFKIKFAVRGADSEGIVNPELLIVLVPLVVSNTLHDGL